MKSLVLTLGILVYGSTAFTFMNYFPLGEKAYCTRDNETRFALYQDSIDFKGRDEKVIDFKKRKGLTDFNVFTIGKEGDGDLCKLVIKNKISDGGKFKVEIGPTPNLLGSYVGTLTSKEGIEEEVICRVSEEVIKSKGCLKELAYIILSNSKPKAPAARSQRGRPSSI